MAKSKADLMKMDLYGILGVSSDATEKEIVKAYRKRALKCHPDKNPDNPKAAELFHELSQALEVLTDASAKVAYDNLLKAKKLAEERNRVLDSKRRKLKDDLEAREKQSDRRKEDDDQVQKNLLAEIMRLRKEGSKLLEQEQAFMKEQMKSTINLDDDEDSDSAENESPKIKLRWSAKKTDTYSAYDEDDLRALFSRYGHIANIIVSGKKKGSAIIEFDRGTPMLILAENERGTDSNPITVTWLSGKPTSYSKPPEKRSSPPPPPPAQNIASASEQTQNFGFNFSSAMSGDARDFESLVLMKMRQAEERKKLIEQMQKEDEEEEVSSKKK